MPPLTKHTMSWGQTTINLSPRPRGCHLITSEIERQLPDLKTFKVGLANVFLQHTSASLCLNENVDPDSRFRMCTLTKDTKDVEGRKARTTWYAVDAPFLRMGMTILIDGGPSNRHRFTCHIYNSPGM
ncbi:hypothetical protein BC938DRAFT_484222 [Jimgerdemannia flammicorona]|uniref:Uncharacterized protein n=1 Tax=Jimgerdemannia flammicorona TaxID=994334 RepID=A0A433QAE9_9FUNG|nr:hypothetical protein BC938DRAFT_484222 [Jimgerdemannia flammicorona]